jgi:hypothetical protein
LANGFANGLRLLAEGMSPILFAAGVIGAVLVALQTRSNKPTRHVWALLSVPALIVLSQFFALGARKPGEYGRFALLPDTVLCIAAVALTCEIAKARVARRAGLALLVATTGIFGSAYVARFLADAQGWTSRYALAGQLRVIDPPGVVPVALVAEPAPYSLPPVNLFDRQIVLLPRGITLPRDRPAVVVRAVDVPVTSPPPPGHFRLNQSEPWWLRGIPSRISWAAKPFEVLVPVGADSGPNGPSRTPVPP